MKSLSLNQPHLLITVGIPGSGKSFFAEKFAATFRAPYVNYSVILEMSGHNSDLSDAYAGYLLKELFKTRDSIVFDGPTATRAERTALKELAASAGYTSLFIWVQTDIETAKARFVKEHSKQHRHITPNQYAAMVKEFTPPLPKEHSTVVISGKHTYATQARAVLKNLAMSKQIARIESPRSTTPVEGTKIIVTKRNSIVR